MYAPNSTTADIGWKNTDTYCILAISVIAAPRLVIVEYEALRNHIQGCHALAIYIVRDCIHVVYGTCLDIA